MSDKDAWIEAMLPGGTTDPEELRRRAKEGWMNPMEDMQDCVRSEVIYGKVLRFFIENHVSCPEAIYQRDQVLMNAYDLLEECFGLMVEDVLAQFIESEEDEVPHDWALERRHHV